MNKELGDIEKIIKYWVETAEKDYVTMQNLIQSKDYSWALFIGHLVLEKLLKAHYVKKNKRHVILSHDLLRIASETYLDLDVEKEEWFDEISTFNINARYDNYKQDFYKLCTKEFVEIWSSRIETLRLWLIREL